MLKKSILLATLILLIVSTGLKSQTTGNTTINVIMNGFEPKLFSPKPVTDSELDMILKCGIRAPSARNGQQWKFTVIKDIKVIETIIPKFVAGNILIIVSGAEFPPEGSNVDIDCAIATESMYIATQGLGLGGQIYNAQISKINTSMRKDLEIPEGYKAILLLRVGNIDSSIDAATAASARKPFENVVNFR